MPSTKLDCSRLRSATTIVEGPRYPPPSESGITAYRQRVGRLAALAQKFLDDDRLPAFGLYSSGDGHRRRELSIRIIQSRSPLDRPAVVEELHWVANYYRDLREIDAVLMQNPAFTQAKGLLEEIKNFLAERSASNPKAKRRNRYDPTPKQSAEYADLDFRRFAQGYGYRTIGLLLRPRDLLGLCPEPKAVKLTKAVDAFLAEHFPERRFARSSKFPEVFVTQKVRLSQTA